MIQHQDDWYKWLSIARFAYSNSVHTLTCSTQFMLDTGLNSQVSMEPLRELCLETLNIFTSRMTTATNEAHSTLAKVLDNMAQFYDAHWREASLYKAREKVWLNGQNTTTTTNSSYLHHLVVPTQFSWSPY